MDIVTYLRNQEGFVCFIGADQEDIEQAEQRLGLKFSQEYRSYVSALGVASYLGHELTGIGLSRHLDVICTTQEERQFANDIPNDWYVVEATHIDGVVFWQNGIGEVFKTSPNCMPQKVADSLLDLLCSI